MLWLPQDKESNMTKGVQVHMYVSQYSKNAHKRYIQQLGAALVEAYHNSTCDLGHYGQ